MKTLRQIALSGALGALGLMGLGEIADARPGFFSPERVERPAQTSAAAFGSQRSGFSSPERFGRPAPASAPAPAPVQAETHGVCSMHLRPDLYGQTHFTAQVAPGISGSYELTVAQRGGGQVADIEQSGPFRADPHAPKTVTTILMLGDAPPERALPPGAGFPGARGFGHQGSRSSVMVMNGPPDRSRLRADFRVYDRGGRLICQTDRIG